MNASIACNVANLWPISMSVTFPFLARIDIAKNADKTKHILTNQNESYKCESGMFLYHIILYIFRVVFWLRE